MLLMLMGFHPQVDVSKKLGYSHTWPEMSWNCVGSPCTAMSSLDMLQWLTSQVLAFAGDDVLVLEWELQKMLEFRDGCYDSSFQQTTMEESLKAKTHVENSYSKSQIFPQKLEKSYGNSWFGLHRNLQNPYFPRSFPGWLPLGRRLDKVRNLIRDKAQVSKWVKDGDTTG